MKKIFKTSMLAIFALLSSTVNAQVTLKMGDDAPPFKYSKWIQGKPVDSFEKDRLYVVEFWATWCGPCAAAMPHLSELAEKYKANATFIGFNIWEKTGEKPYEASIPAVTNFVKNMSGKLTYNVAVDNNEQYMGNKWMKAAGQYGIPATFLVKDGKIIWIGHPMKLDSIMPLAIAGKYDMDNYKKGFDGKNESMARMVETLNSFMNPALAAMKAKELDKALALLDQGEESVPKFAMLFKRVKAKVLLSKNEENGIIYIKDWVKEMPGVASAIAADIIERDDLTKISYGYAVGVLKESYINNKEGMPLISHMMATAYARAGDLPNAIIAEQQAIEQAKVAIKEGKFKELIMDTTIPEYEASLKKYQDGTKK